MQDREEARKKRGSKKKRRWGGGRIDQGTDSNSETKLCGRHKKKGKKTVEEEETALKT